MQENKWKKQLEEAKKKAKSEGDAWCQGMRNNLDTTWFWLFGRLALQYLGGVTARVQLFLLLDQPNCHMKGPFQPKSSSYILQTRPSFVSKGEDTNLPD